MDIIAAGPSDHADLAAGPGAVFRRIGVRVDAEFLDVLQARLQFERGRDFAVQVARRRVDDGRALDAVEADHVLLDAAAAEADVAERARSAVERAWRLQVELR